MQGPSRLHVEAEVDVRALAVHHVDLGEPGSLALTQCVDDELFLRDRVRPLLLLRRREGAELALHSTDVRLVQIQVLDEVDAIVTAAPPAREIGQLTEREQIVRLEQRHPVLEVEPLARLHLLADEIERGKLVEKGHQLSRSTTRSVRVSSSSR